MRTIKQDLLVFVGTKQEVDEQKAIERCFYFAWDTGEFFLGAANNKKRKYGGSNKTLSAEEVRQIAEDMTNDLLGDVRLTQEEYRKEVNFFMEKVNSAVREINDKFNKIQVDTEVFVKDVVATELPKALENYYDKPEIDDKIKNFVTSEGVNELTKDYIKYDSISDNTVQYKHGRDIINNAYKLKGLYLCLSDYVGSNNTLYKGYVYSVNNGNIEEIASGTGGGGSIDPEIKSFLIDDKEYHILEYGKLAFSEFTKISYEIKNSRFINKIVLYYDDQPLPIEIDKKDGKHDIHFDLRNIDQNIGYHEFRLVGLSNTGNTFDKKVSCSITRCIYYGSGKETMLHFSPSQGITEGLKRRDPTLSPNGYYDALLNNENELNYVWIAIPDVLADKMFVNENDITCNGFKFPTISFYQDNYRLFRSANELLPGRVVVKVTGSGSLQNKGADK